ncbi:hypothetical protein GWK08_13565 [Leptobacterium flavescens]|uniref:Chromosome partitioning protein ParA n=1 Tax=Leptobacterium flavescens TaxID=472055 RepID=A0A6P0UVN5_9FLAO|nr:hypothetical protein [Leptobacterium flavescens]NER14476.1 hypothetical protein [Leptobacterium flavescens]
MKPQNKQLGQKIILGALFLAIATLISLTYFNYMESGEKVAFLANEKEMIIKDLKQMQESFGELTDAKGKIADEIKANRERITTLLDSLDLLEVDYNILQTYRGELSVMRKENERYRKIIDSIQYENLLLEREIDISNLKISELSEYTEALKDTNSVLSNYKDSLMTANSELTDKITEGSILNIYNLRGVSYKSRSNGRVAPTSRAAKTDLIRTCFVILPNRLLKNLSNDIYIQIIDAKNNVLGEKKTIHFDNEVLTYSKKVAVKIKDQPLDVCDYITTDGNSMSKGNYIVNVFYNEKLLATSTFQLK